MPRAPRRRRGAGARRGRPRDRGRVREDDRPARRLRPAGVQQEPRSDDPRAGHRVPQAGREASLGGRGAHAPADPAPPPKPPRPPLAGLILAVEPRAWEVRKAVVYDQFENTVTMRFTRVVVNGGLPDTTFTFVPPARAATPPRRSGGRP